MQLTPKRRYFLKLSMAGLSGLLSGFWFKSARAAWVGEHFRNSQFEGVLGELFAGQSLQESELIKLSVPAIAENGAVVPITISCELDNIKKIYLLVEKNPTPLAAEFELSNNVSAFIGARIKMAESCYVHVVVEHDSGLLMARQWVTVMQGGCGTG
jgi:sulfur-oxidizing protein SoxY